MTTRYQLKMQHCYGIPALEHEFTFENNNMPVAIYAPNGLMKTSLARSFKDFTKGQTPSDLVYPERESSFHVLDENGEAVQNDAIFVVDSINEKYSSAKMSTLLASEELKAEYDEVFNSVGLKREALLKVLKKKAGMTKGIEEAFCSAVGLPQNEFLTALGTVEREVKKDAYAQYSDVTYKVLFDPKVVELLDDDEIQKLISQYSEVYDQLLEESQFFKRGVFNHTNAGLVAKNLKDNGWFRGGHTVSLKTGDGVIEISNEAELGAQIEDEKQRILTDQTLGEMFAKVDGKLSTKPLQLFREHLLEHPYLVPELHDINALKRRVWIGYLTTMKSEFVALLDEYDASVEKLKGIVVKAEAELTHWEKVIAKFNKRFTVPFKVGVKNKADAVLGIEGPQIEFIFKDADGNADRRMAPDKLSQVLSNGERRALYILNIIFEVEALTNAQHETLLVVDDIADSFDYKNKYAIIEYLRDISRVDYFHLMVLTHNFDFYRTVKGRLNVHNPNKLIAGRFENEIRFQGDSMGDNPIGAWTGALDDPKCMVGCIPFVRNLAEYSGDDATFLSLTNLLHVKAASDAVTFDDLQAIFQGTLSASMTNGCYSGEESVLATVAAMCEEIIAAPLDEVELLDKVILSMGIRLATERFIIGKLADPNFVDGITKHQTSKLIKRYNRENEDEVAMALFEQVLLMTPENIHMNSFMFEPILDMAPLHLHDLYRDVIALND
ncbi:AAA family ATPase [Octadecabacter sp. 1_MG-2023]|uniref:AAA family ATPase n=1 Tax=unclassified Octadecabacter TaxID=196158 RepID=UPI001C0882FB|nr:MULTISPECIES: AAA family ATPase [unclassified Octadecabacter]MBU2994353.1 AAA family ATPase [Octadecabacter sp. B2R22]MDO6734358.1 AAA family ATPase [Octadecabacter sp. 1_MG-2023]